MGRALEHLEDWIRDNVNETIYPDEGGDAVAASYAERYRAKAAADGISIQEAEAECGSIEERMAAAVEESVDAEMARAMGKDRF